MGCSEFSGRLTSTGQILFGSAMSSPKESFTGADWLGPSAAGHFPRGPALGGGLGFRQVGAGPRRSVREAGLGGSWSLTVTDGVWMGRPHPLGRVTQNCCPPTPTPSPPPSCVHSPTFSLPLASGPVTQGGAALSPRARKSSLQARPPDARALNSVTM